MKLILQIFSSIVIILLCYVSTSWSGAEGLFLVYQLEVSDVDGALNLRPVEIQFDMAGDTNPTYGVFAEWRRPYVHDTDKIDLEQRNKAYCKGLKFNIKHDKRDHIDVFLDYTACKDKPRSENDRLFEGIAAAIFYTENVPKIQTVTTMNLFIKGITNQKEISKSYTWVALQKKWQPSWGDFQYTCK